VGASLGAGGDSILGPKQDLKRLPGPKQLGPAVLVIFLLLRFVFLIVLNW
jgi:hypothetical protein